MEKELTSFVKDFDYEDMKVAIVVSEFYTQHQEEMAQYELFEDMISLCQEIREKWEKADEFTYGEEAYAYIQCFADYYLTEKFLRG